MTDICVECVPTILLPIKMCVNYWKLLNIILALFLTSSVGSCTVIELILHIIVIRIDCCNPNPPPFDAHGCIYLTQSHSCVSGSELGGVTYKHPIYEDRKCPLLPADHVTTTVGTGLVHTAPAHGHDDFKVALKHDLNRVSKDQR